MKYSFTKVITSLLLLATIEAAHATGNLSIINGSTNEPIQATIALFKVKNGEVLNTVSYELHNSRQFSFAIEATTGSMYYIVINAQVAIDGKMETRRIANMPLYIKAGETIDLNVNLSKEPELLVKEYKLFPLSAENTALQNWVKKAAPIVAPWQVLQTPVPYKTYYSNYQKLLPSLTAYAQQLKVPGNPEFTRTLQAMAAAQLKFSPWLMYFKQKEWQAAANTATMKPMLEGAYKQLATFCKAAILNAGMGNEITSLYDAWYYNTQDLKQVPKEAAGKISEMQEVVKLICNDTLKGFYITQKLNGLYKISATDFETSMAGLQPYLKLPYMQAAYLQKLKELSGGPRNATDQTDPMANNTLPAAALPSNSANTLIQGVLSNFSISGEVGLYSVHNGAAQLLSRQRLSRNERHFTLTTIVEKAAFYYLQCGNLTFRMYLQPKDQLQVKISSEANSVNGKNQSSYDVLNGSAENKALQQWFTTSLPVTVHGLTNRIVGMDTMSMPTYLSFYEKVSTALPAFEQQATTNNATFNRLFKQAMQVDLEFAPLLFLAYQTDKARYLLPTTFNRFQSVPDFFRGFIAPQKFCSTDVLYFKEGADYINLYSKLRLALYEQKAGKQMAENEQLKWMLDGICSDSIRSFVLEQQMDEREILNLSEFNAKFLPVKEYAITASAKRRYNEVFAVYANDTLFLGKPAMDISLPDTSGNMVNLNSFKGKVIFIDTWATWCGPCKEQLPFLKELEASYKNDTGIVFAGISIDREKDKEKWKKMIRTENLPGIQLFDDFGKQFRNPMMIESIPRFLLIDKNGNWIEVRCPKPDQKEKIRSYIEKAIQAN